MINFILYAFVTQVVGVYLINISRELPLAHKTVAHVNHSSLIPTKRVINRLKIYNEKRKNEEIRVMTSDSDKYYSNKINKIKQFTPANKEWTSSIYTYFNNSENILYTLNKSLMTLIKSLVNLYNNKLEKNVRRVRSRRIESIKARRSTNNILISSPELKHTNDKVIITLYVHDAKKRFYLNKLKKISNLYASRKKNEAVSNLKKSSLNLKSILEKYNKSFSRLIKKNSELNKNIKSRVSIYGKDHFKYLARKILRKQIVFSYYKQLIVFNKIKFETKYVTILTNQINRIYNKNVEFNFVRLKYPYFNSYTFSTALITKIKKLSRVKKSFMTAVKKSLNMLKIPSIKSQDIYEDMYNRKMVYQNHRLDTIIPGSREDKSNILDHSLLNVLPKTESKKGRTDLGSVNDLSKLTQVFKLTKNKFLNGVRIEIAGRLTKRSSAVRSVFKIRNKGNIRNRDSSDKGLSTIMLRGHAKSNLQYNNLYSKVRGGSFGLKGRVSSY